MAGTSPAMTAVGIMRAPKENHPVVFPRARAIAHCVRAAPRYIPSRAILIP
jgi:hypothetical protein